MSADEPSPEHSAMWSTDPYATRVLRIQELGQPPVEALRAGRPATRPAKRRMRPPRLRGSALLNTFLLLLTLVVVGIGGGLYYLDRSYQGRIYPNVTIQGVPVGELTPQQAEAALRAHYGDLLAHPATLTFEDRAWQPTSADLGLHVDFAGAVEAAYRAGRKNGLIENLQEIAAIWENGLELPLHASIDQRAIQHYVQGLAGELDQAPADAQLHLNGTQASTTPMRIGRQVLVDQVVQDLTAQLMTFKPQTVAVRTRAIQPRLSDSEVAAAKQRLEAMFQGPLTLTAGDRQYTWQPEEIALMTDIARVAKSGAADRIVVELNQYQINRRIRQIANEIGRGSVNPRVDWNGGNLKIIVPGKSGQRLDETAALHLINTSVAGAQRVLALPVQEVAPQVSEANLNQLGIKELVAVGKSDFTGSEHYRVTNINAGMKLLHGILLAPGEEFSFNDNIGAIDEEHGFVEGYAIVQNRVQLEYGGGICQDSTTMFRAAFWAGLPITERWGHSFYINWYDKYGLGTAGNGPGLDATIFLGGPDLKFVNDTGHWLLIQTFSDPKTGLAEVRLYGTKPNRTVEITHRIYDRVPPIATPVYFPDPKQPRGTIKQTDTARGGMTIDVYRVITENGVRKEPELFRTVFKPWANKFAVNPADLGPDGKPLPQPAPPSDPAAQPTPAPEQPAQPSGQPTPAPAQPAPENQ